MAHIVYNSGFKKSLPAEQALKLWKALHNPAGLSDDQIDRLREIKAIYLNWHTAPAEYIRENLGSILPLALADWAVDRKTGKPTRPASDRAWVFAKRWGLWENGKPTDLVTRGVTLPAQTALAGGFMVND
jgi:hypothetical protein